MKKTLIFGAFKTDLTKFPLSSLSPLTAVRVDGIKQTKWETCNEKAQAKTFLPLTNKFLPSVHSATLL